MCTPSPAWTKLEEKERNNTEEKGKKMTGDFINWNCETEEKGKNMIDDYINWKCVKPDGEKDNMS